MSSILTVTTAASDLALLTIEELRSAAGVTGGASDDGLRAMGLRVAASIMTECNIAVGSGAPPTLLRETLVQTIRSRQSLEQLVLARRHEVVISSVVADGSTLDAADYEVEPESGLVTRLCNDWASRWCCGKVVVTYDAGFSAVPDDLRQAAMKAASVFWTEAGRDAGLKRVEIPGVMTKEYWVEKASDVLLPDEVKDALKRFRNVMV